MNHPACMKKDRNFHIHLLMDSPSPAEHIQFRKIKTKEEIP